MRHGEEGCSSESVKRTPKRYRCTQILLCGCGLKSSVFLQPVSFLLMLQDFQPQAAFPAPQFTNIIRQCTQLVIIKVQSPVSILTFSHSSFFSSPILSGNAVNWLLLKSSLQYPFSHSAIPVSSVHQSCQAMQSTGYYSSPVSSIHSHIQPFQLLQFTNFLRQCSQLVITQVQSPISFLACSHSSFFSSPISWGNVVIWLLLKSHILDFFRFTEMFYVW